MHTNTAQYGVVAKRRLPSDFHTPVPLIPPAARINGTRRIRRATSVVVLPSVKLYKTAGKVSAALSPDKNPLAVGSLPVVRPKSNSRFFTDCYHQPAAIRPGDGRKTGVLRSVPPRLAGANGSCGARPRPRARQQRTPESPATGAGRTGRTLGGIFSGSSCSSRRPRPTAASRRSRLTLRFSG